MVLPEKSELSGLDDTKFYIYKNHIRTNFGGFGQAIKFDMNHQLFDFMEMGRPQFIAPLNMFPHQAKFNLEDITLNEYANGMFNTRFLSADQTASMDYSVNPFAVNSLVFNPLTLDEKEAYTRIKYYEGDQGYSDLDIFFSRNFGANAKIQLAGFNKGFPGYYYNSSHTGVAYNTKLDYRINEIFAWDFSWLRNHEISGMGLPTQPENFTYQADAELFGLRFYYKPDTTDLNKITLGLFSGYNYHRNRSKENSYSATQISDNYKL